MSKGNLGIVKAGKGEELRTKSTALQTHTLKTITARRGRITTHTGRTK